MCPTTLAYEDPHIQESTYGPSEILGEPQPCDSASFDPTDEPRASAQSDPGPAQTGPTRNRKAPPSLEPGWQTVRKQTVIAGRTWIYQHAFLDDECVMDLDWREELLYQHIEFWSSIHKSPQIVGNPKLAKRITARLDRSNKRRKVN